MSWFSEIADLIKPIKEYLPAAAVGMDIYGQIKANQGRNDYADNLKAREDANYANQKATYDQYVQWLQGKQQHDQASAAARNAASRAAAGAANQTEANRQAASKKGYKAQKRYYNEAQGLFQPYVDAGRTILPQMTAAYGSGMQGLNLLQAYLQQPNQQAKLGASVPAWSTNVPLPSYMKGK